uniref:Uncharacterized protein LOC100371933 n=1 Tax=Saccoglossus kowalevskii TaxID=10224 RepID=A0ABM0MMM7_SACKO|nr:PREDICTED: uncharacterized protein LOC100371933 [Saccoglossus kowalevskii]
MDVMLQSCHHLGVPIATEKVEGPCSVITFLGVELDTVNMVIRLPKDKLADLLVKLPSWLTRHTCSKRELLSLIGCLSFACKCMLAGRIFLRRMIDISMTATSLSQVITLTDEFWHDVQWWCDFLPSWNGTASLLNPNWIPSPEFELFTDASATLGYGAFYKGHWFANTWPTFITNDPLYSIAWKELLPILLSSLIWGHLWYGLRIRFHCDNISVVQIWKKGSSSCPRIMQLVRLLFFTAASNNFHVMISHISGFNNDIADSLSRQQILRFQRLTPQADRVPTKTPDLCTLLTAPICDVVPSTSHNKPATTST